MKLEITISDTVTGEVWENVVADMSDSPEPENQRLAARWLIDLIESRVDVDESD